MDELYNVRLIGDIILMIEQFVSNNSSVEKISIVMEIVTTNGDINIIELSNESKVNIKVNSKLLLYKNLLITLKDISKLRILTSRLNSESIKNNFINELNNTINLYYKNKYNNQNIYRRQGKICDNGIEEYIKKYHKNIKSLSYDGIFNKYKNNNTNINEKNILNLQKKSLNVINDIDTNGCNIFIESQGIKGISNIDQNELNVVSDVRYKYTQGVIGNINKETNIINTKYIDILDIEPINKHISKEEINSRPLKLDPTGENYIGVVLDDGTFEPLKLAMKKLKVLDENTINILGNINSDKNINTCIEDIDILRENSLKSIDIEYKDMVEYKYENLKPLKDIIKVSNIDLNNIINHENTKIRSYEKELNKKTLKEDINGNIEYVDNEVLIIDNYGLGISIYSIDKIKSIN